MKYGNLLLALVLFSLACLFVGCSGKVKDKQTVDPNEVRVVLRKDADGVVCRTVYILKDHGGVMTCRDSSGTLVQMRDSYYATPWGRDIQYYPNGQIMSESFYESMSVQPVYRKEFYENGNLKYLEDSVGKRTFDKNGRLLEADTVALNWRYNRSVMQDGSFSINKQSLDGDSSYWASYNSNEILRSEESRSSKGWWRKYYDSTGVLYYSKSESESLRVETDYYPDGKIWMNKVFEIGETAWGKGLFVLKEFKEYAENGVALREYELDTTNPKSVPVCHFRNAAGDSLAFPEPREKNPYSLRDDQRYKPFYSFVDSCTVPGR